MNELTEQPLTQIPEFYSSIPNNPSVDRLASIDVKVNLPYITEYIENIATTATMTENFKKKYKKIPLVLGLGNRTDFLGNAVMAQLLPDGVYVFPTKTAVTIKNLTVGGKYRLRVYNLDMI